MKSFFSTLTFLLVILVTALSTTALAFYTQDNQKTSDAAPTRVVVKLHSDVEITLAHAKGAYVLTGVKCLDALNAKYAITVQQRLFPLKQDSTSQFRNVFIVDIPDGADINAMIADYEDMDVVEYAHPDWQAELYDVPDDPLYSHQWALHNTGQAYYFVQRNPGSHDDELVLDSGVVDADIDAQEVFIDPSDNTSTVVVAIIDTGVDLDHPELSGRIWTNPGEIPDNGLDDDHNGYVDDIHGWDYTGDITTAPPIPDNDPTDEHGHGTHCAGIITAVTGNGQGIAGILDNCEIMALKFYPVMLSSYAAQAIVYAADNGADVISMSWGYPWSPQVVQNALSYAREKGVVLVAAAGNDGEEFYNYPASYQGVITIAASTSGDEVAFFSTFGTHLNLSAPGYGILSLRADTTDMYAQHSEPNVHIIEEYYYLASGTSMSCPHVAAVAAYLRAVSPGLTPDETEQIMEATADDYLDPFGAGGNLPGWDIYSGYGRVNLHSALQASPALAAAIDFPSDNNMTSGIVEVLGTADGIDFNNYVLEYGTGDLPSSWTEITSSISPVTDGILASWNTVGLNGRYSIRLRVGETNEARVSFYLVNSSLVSIISPTENDTVSGLVEVIGTASGPQFESCLLEYGSGIAPSVWTEIVTLTQPKVNDHIVDWNTSDLTPGVYTLKLTLETGTVTLTDSIVLFIESVFAGDNGWRVTLPTSISPNANYGDFDNDGHNEIVVGFQTGLRFFNMDGSEKTEGVPDLPSYDFRIPVAVGDLDGDGRDDLVAVSGNAKLFGFLSTEADFEVNLLYSPAMGRLSSHVEQDYPSVCLKDINSDGRDEIIYHPGAISDISWYCAIYNSDGSLFKEVPTLPDSRTKFLAADIDGDGLDEFYYAGNYLYMADTSAQILLGPIDLGPQSGSFKVSSLSAADIDYDGKHELIVFGQNPVPDEPYLVYAFDENLTLKPGWPHNTGITNFLIPYAPLFADIDRDSTMEYFLSLFELAYGQIYAWNVHGTPYGNDPVFAVSPNPAKIFTLLLADVTGDDYPEIIADAQPDVFYSYKRERWIGWNGDGTASAGWPITTVSSGTDMVNFSSHTPSIGDVNRDGDVDIFSTTLSNELVFTSLEGIPWNPEASPAPMHRYNRRLNFVKPLMLVEPILCGDADGNGIVELPDVICLVNYIFVVGAPPPLSYYSGDADCNTIIEITDAVYLISYVFIPGSRPPCDPDNDGEPDC